MQGTLIIKARSAKLTRDTELMGKMDPYCVIKVGNASQKTKVKEDAGKTPVWEETFKLKAAIGDIVSFEVWDKETIKKDDLVGSGQFSISQLHVNNQNEFEQDIFYEKKKAGMVVFEIEFVPDPVEELKPGENKQSEEKKETDQEAIVKMQEELDKLWENIEEQREKNKPVDNRKKKDFSALNNSIAQARKDILRAKEEIAKFDQDLQGIIDKFRLYLEEQKQAKKLLEGEHGELGALRTIVLPGTLGVNLIDGQINNKSDKSETILIVSVGEQIKSIKSKQEIGKDPEWKENLEFNINTETTIFFVFVTPEKNGLQTLGIAGESLYHVSHGKETEKYKLKVYNKDVNVGFVNFEMNFKGI